MEQARSCVDVLRPSVHWYPTPLPPFKRIVHWRTSFLRGLLRQTKHYAHDGACADWFFIAHQDHGSAQVRKTSDVVRMFNYIAHRWAWYNRTGGHQHFLHSPCDHGPKDCLYAGHRAHGTDEELQPSFTITPKSPQRTLAFLMLNGDPSAAYHRRGLDIRLPTPEGHTCGPFCGMASTIRDNHTEATLLLRQLSPWTTTRPVVELHRMLRARRPTLLFFAGRAHKGLRSALFMHHVNRTGFCLHDTSGSHKSVDDASAASESNWLPRMMAESSFCFSPLGTSQGDSDRYLPAVLYGCIPVFVGEDVPPFAEVIDWERASVRLKASEFIPHLDEVLGNYSHGQIVRMRQALRTIWQKLLWTRALQKGLLGRPKGSVIASSTTMGTGSYLGESGDDDALVAFLAVLAVRSKTTATE